jgi:hypothetical protein
VRYPPVAASTPAPDVGVGGGGGGGKDGTPPPPQAAAAYLKDAVCVGDTVNSPIRETVCGHGGELPLARL